MTQLPEYLHRTKIPAQACIPSHHCLQVLSSKAGIAAEVLVGRFISCVTHSFESCFCLTGGTGFNSESPACFHQPPHFKLALYEHKNEMQKGTKKPNPLGLSA